MKERTMHQLKEVGTIQLREVVDRATEQLQSLLGLKASSVIAASRREDGWHVTIELIERKAIPDTQDLLGTYDILLDDEGDMMSYERTRIRRRMDLEEFVE
jgi:hypothetical protein